jgi:hypothetical protein
MCLLIGMLLIKRGRWPRRVGETVHCRKCDYILAGEPSRCSECGTPVDSRTVVRGERPRRAAMAWIGVPAALFGLALLTPQTTEFFSQIQWIHYEPLSWLLRDLGNSNLAVSVPAWGEIQRRLNENRLSDTDQSALVDKGLIVQTVGWSFTDRNAILDYVAARYLAQKLTGAQADRFFAGMLKVNLSVRAIVGSRSRVPYLISGAGQGPDKWWMHTRDLEARVDDGPIQKLGGSTGGGFDGWSSGSTLDPATKPGKHTLHLKVELATDVDRGSGVNWNDNAVVAKRVTQDLTADFQVVEGLTPIATLTGPNASALRPLLKPTLRHDPTYPGEIWVNVDAAALPVDAAFAVFLRSGGREFPAGSVSFHKGSPGGYGTGAQNVPADVSGPMDVIFRSSETVARETVSLTQIWKGEVIVANVPLPRPAPSSQAYLPASTQP